MPHPTSTVACAAVVSMAAAMFFLRRRRQSALPLPLRKLRELPSADVPPELLVCYYVDLDAASARGYEHVAYLRECSDVSAVLDGLHEYCEATMARFMMARRGVATVDSVFKLARDASVHSPDAPASWVVQGQSGEVIVEEGAAFAPERLLGPATAATSGADEPTLYVCKGARVQGGAFDLSGGGIYLGAGAVVEPGVLVRGPAIIGAGVTLRHGAYVRGDAVLGSGGVFGGELKNVLALDGAELPHTGYCGDTLLGYRAHFGCGTVTANFPLFAGARPALVLPAARYDLGRRKFGAVLGDGCQLGCGCVTEPGCLLAPNTHALPLCRLPRGAYGPNVLLKARPARVEAAPLR